METRFSHSKGRETKSHYHDYPGNAVTRMKKKLKHDTCTFAPTVPVFRPCFSELALLYEQIKLIKKMKKMGEKDRDPITIEELRKRTSSSKDSWAEDVIKNREDRI
jgi:hypothetical protein